MRPELSVGEALVGLLQSYGVETIFGIPGVHNVEMYRALPRSNIKHVLVRHEQGAGFMADGYARATGKPGVCFTITGPGLLNILTPMAQAWSDSSNILVISSALDIADSAQGRGRLHEMINQFGAAAAVTHLAMRAYTAKDVQDCVARAFTHFASGRPRPVYLEIPLDLLSAPAGPGWQARALPQPQLPNPIVLDLAAQKLNTAKQPMMILGGGALGAGAAALKIAGRIGCPILTTTAGKGAVPADHPLCWGYLLGLPEIQKQLMASDCILAVGTELSETDFWTSAAIITKNLIRIDIDLGSLARPHSVEIAIHADANLAMTALAERITPQTTSIVQIAPPTEQSTQRDILTKVLAVVRNALPPETVLCSDMTQIAYTANEIFPVLQPKTWIHPVGFGTLGFGLPAGIGAKFGVGKTPVAVLAGDYGFQYSLNELGTAVEHALPLIILLWNNEVLGAIKDDMVQKGIQPNAVTLRNPNFQVLAKAYDLAYEKPENLKTLHTAIIAALVAPGPTLIEMTPRITND